MAKRQYNNPYPSVTTVLSVLRKIGLEKWYQWNDGRWCEEESKKGKEIGTQIHTAVQAHIEEREVKVKTQYGEEVMNALKSFMLFRKECPGIELKRSEMVLTSEKYRYNGTLDCIGKNAEGTPIILDWKTGKCKEKDKPTIYDEHIYQVAAYVYAYNEQEKENIKEAFILCVAKDVVAYNLLHLDKDALKSNFEEVFLPALKICNHQKGAK